MSLTRDINTDQGLFKICRNETDTYYPSKHETSTQCWASVVDGGPTSGGCLVFAGIASCFACFVIRSWII